MAAWTLSGLFAGAPLVMMLAGAFVLRRYALDEREHARIQRQLLESRATRGS
jgi:Na+/melibiose symporter-like transporter